jgi:mono/diheme cytochrome c family protein
VSEGSGKEKVVLKTVAGLMVLLAAPVYGQAPEQAQRGGELFGQKNCSNCHQFDGRGTAIGPDLKNIARVSPRAIGVAILSTRTQNVISVKLKAGESFPAIRAKEDEKSIELYDLTKDPPALRKFERAEIESTKDNESWKHPPATTELTNEQLADVIAYIRWVALRDKKGVDPSEVR